MKTIIKLPLTVCAIIILFGLAMALRTNDKMKKGIRYDH